MEVGIWWTYDSISKCWIIFCTCAFLYLLRSSHKTKLKYSSTIKIDLEWPWSIVIVKCYRSLSMYIWNQFYSLYHITIHCTKTKISEIYLAANRKKRFWRILLHTCMKHLWNKSIYAICRCLTHIRIWCSCIYDASFYMLYRDVSHIHI